MTGSVKIIVATHKDYTMPEDELYLPVFVGAELVKDIPNGYTQDNSGENISALNPYFCELTGLYWAWKNLDYDYIGLTHYRRHFSLKKSNKHLLNLNELSPFLGKIKVFTPSKRKYYIETICSHYSHTFHREHLEEAKSIINEKYPEYSASFDRAVSKTWGYMFNMMIMEKDLLNNYCTWLFDILFELRQRIDETEMDAFQRRYPGRVAEILFNVWIDYMLTEKKLSKNEIMEIPVVSMEKVNCLKKGTAFLKAKFFGVKYNKSF